MRQPQFGLISSARARERVVVHVGSPTARWFGALAVFGAGCWLVVLLARDYRHGDWLSDDRLGWSLTVLVAVALIARGIFLGRPVKALHATAAAGLLVAGLAIRLLLFDVLGDVLIVSSGLVLMWPTRARPRSEDLPRVWTLINATRGDPLAPFALQTGKCYHFSRDGRAALAYRTRMGFAVVSGDPIGDETQFGRLIADFTARCHDYGWRPVVVGCSERRVALWRDSAALGRAMRAVPIGRDVVVNVDHFELVGRKYRNLRQAVNRTHNAGITTEVVAERDLDDKQHAELAAVVHASATGAHADRGYCMNLDGVLSGRFPGIQLIVARDASGRAVGFHRYATAGGGSDLSLDVPRRRRNAPNGIDERLSVDMIAVARSAGAQRVSLAFAAFDDLFNDVGRSGLRRCAYWLIHLLDPLIALESLYRYVRKFHALAERRYALVSLTQVVPLLFVLLSLEFMPRRRRL